MHPASYGLSHAVAATAFGHRSWPYNFLVTTMWTDPAQTDPNVEWTRKFFSAMKPFLADAGYVNYLSDVGEDAVRTAYGRKYQRLSALKAKYDPTNFFCRNQNIRTNIARSLKGIGHPSQLFRHLLVAFIRCRQFHGNHHRVERIFGF